MTELPGNLPSVNLEQFKAMIASIPQALDVGHKMDATNEAIVLYDGPMNVTLPAETISGTGIIGLRWQPEASLCFEVDGIVSLPPDPLASDATVEAVDIGLIVPARILNQNVSIQSGQGAGLPIKLFGNIFGPCQVGTGNTLSCVAFSIPNGQPVSGTQVRYETDDPNQFSTQGARHVFTFDEYSVTLELTPNAIQMAEECSKLRGYGITYIGRIARTDGATFNCEQARDALIALGHMLSFCWGRWTFPILLTGYGASSVKVWEDWGLPRIDAWESRSTWLSSANDNVFVDLANGYSALYNNPDWSDAIRIATHWYIDALAADVVETALVLSQCGLELLTWTWFKEDRRHTPPAGFDGRNVTAEFKIKKMLDVAGIVPTIPPHFTELTTASALYPGHDGLAMFILLRNGAVHANKLPRLLAWIMHD